jgi:uncharacterized protein involved in exopolysaccharide biosynthesis
MLEMTGYQSQLDILQNEVNTAQKAYDGVTQRLDLMRLQSGLPTTNAQQVDHATPPLLPTSPNVPIVMLLAALLGLALGIIAALVLEWRRPLIRTPEGMVRATGISVLGSFHFSALKPAHVLRLGGY